MTPNIKCAKLLLKKVILWDTLPARGGANPLLPNSSEMAWNFQMPFYRNDSGTLRVVYVNFHKPICFRDFSMTTYYFRVL